MAAGLASRRFPEWLPAFIGKYPGDALWALMVFFGFAALFPRWASLRVAALALGFSFAIEILKLWQAPWLVAVRHNVIGQLIFGHAFSWQNLVAYTLGVALGLGIERGLQHRR